MRLAPGSLPITTAPPRFLGYLGYPKSLCLSPNDVIVHGIPDEYRLRDGDILSVDAGAIYEGFHGDAAFTVGIGEVTSDARELIETTEGSDVGRNSPGA